MWAASGVPEFESTGRDVLMSEFCEDIPSRLSMLTSVWGVLQGLSGMLVAGQVILFSLLLAHAVGMRGAVV
jgi:hypothetical protein